MTLSAPAPRQEYEVTLQPLLSVPLERELPLGQDEARVKSRIMQRILVNDAEVRHLAEPWLPDLHRLMQGKTPTLH